jgi:hypothetical protein
MKIFDANCAAGIVLVDGLPVVGCSILGEGIGPSSGYLVMAENNLVYLPKTTPDVKTLIQLVESLCDSISSLTVTTIALGSPTSPPLNSAAFLIIKAQLAALKNTLK